MQNYLKIIAIVFLIGGIGAFIFAATQYPNATAVAQVVAARQKELSEAITEAKAAVGTDNEAVTKEYAEKQANMMKMAAQQQAQVNQQITISAVVGVVLVIVGGVLWFIARKRATT